MKTKALYAGSFDPITFGHIDIIERASKLYDSLVVAVVANPNKNSFFSIDERVNLINLTLSKYENVEVVAYSGLLADFVNDNGFNAVVRGLRNSEDFVSEMNMSHINSKLYKLGTETVFLMTSPEYSYVSSSVVRELAGLGGDISGFVPADIAGLVYDKCRRK